MPVTAGAEPVDPAGGAPVPVVARWRTALLLAERFKVSRPTIGRIVRKQAWKHL
jgi:hypothetical protein